VSRPRISWPRLPLAVQLGQLRHVWPELVARVHRGSLRAEGWVRPNSLCESYRIQLVYTPPASPKVWVREPRIVAERAPGDRVPHVYDRFTDPRPCLFYPNEREWRSDKLIAHTILPWLLLWLAFYEVWLVTGIWKGGGVEHGPVKYA
jgi:hypothetical protein